jgi:hypothetical protein
MRKVVEINFRLHKHKTTRKFTPDIASQLVFNSPFALQARGSNFCTLIYLLYLATATASSNAIERSFEYPSPPIVTP